MSKRICIIDYGAGNSRSVYNAFTAMGVPVVISNKVEDIKDSTHLILPGVGAFGAVVEKIRALPSFEHIKDEVVKKGKPFLGICIGMQILASAGEEYGNHEGLAWIPGTVKRLEVKNLSLPHIGWNNFKNIRSDGILKGITNDMDFYYLHSYHFVCDNCADMVATCEYEIVFSAVVKKENIYGVQFHPEKSQKSGRRLVENFIRLS